MVGFQVDDQLACFADDCGRGESNNRTKTKWFSVVFFWCTILMFVFSLSFFLNRHSSAIRQFSIRFGKWNDRTMIVVGANTGKLSGDNETVHFGVCISATVLTSGEMASEGDINDDCLGKHSQVTIPVHGKIGLKKVRIENS